MPRLRYSEAEIAKELGISRMTLYRLRRGKVRNANEGILSRLREIDAENDVSLEPLKNKEEDSI